MTDADELRSKIRYAISLAEKLQVITIQYEQTVHDFQHECVVLDVLNDNVFSRSIGRIAPTIANSLDSDKESIGEVKTELQLWLPHV